MGRPQVPEAADVPDDEPWTPPGMSPLRKVGLTLLMVMLGVVPGLLLLASDPLPDSSDEVAPEARRSPGNVGARDGLPVDDAAPVPEVPLPTAPASTPDVEDDDRDDGPDKDDEEREDRDDRPRRRSQSDDGQRDRRGDHDHADDEDDDHDDDGPVISLRLGQWD
jgi:hypothetical protein